jgi:hypothetical protein
VIANSPRTRAFVFSACILFGCAAGLSAAISALKLNVKHLPIEVPLKCSSIPKQTRSWQQVGQDDLMNAELVETLGTHNYLSRVYVEKNAPGGREPRAVQLHLAYYTGMVDTVPHVPDRCFVAGGATMIGGPWVVHIPLKGPDSDWIQDQAASADTARALGIKDAKIYTTRLGETSSAPGNRVRLPRGIEGLDMRTFEFKQGNSGPPTFSGYFFIANGGLTSLAQDVRLLAFDLKSDYAFYLKVQFTSASVKDADELAQLAGSLLDEILPDIMLVVPDWTDVIRGDYPPDNPRRLHK